MNASVSAITISADGDHKISELRGYAVRSGGAAMAANLRDAGATGKILWPINLGANASDGDIWHAPIQVPSGVLHVEQVSGAISGTLFE